MDLELTTKFLLFAVLKVRAENLKKEKDILKMSDVRLTQQRDSLLVEQRGQNLLLTNLRTIQVCGAILMPRLGLSGFSINTNENQIRDSWDWVFTWIFMWLQINIV